VQHLADGRKAFERPQSTFVFAGLAGGVSTLLGATIGVGSLLLTGYASWSNSVEVWVTWWLGDATGDVIVAPLVLLWAARWRLGWNCRQTLEAMVLLASLLLVGMLVFGGWLPRDNNPLEFLCIPSLLWAAFRFGRRIAATTHCDPRKSGSMGYHARPRSVCAERAQRLTALPAGFRRRSRDIVRRRGRDRLGAKTRRVPSTRE
ncbi:MAG: MASE1 domain-containing protein, partial [bacterium]